MSRKRKSVQIEIHELDTHGRGVGSIQDHEKLAVVPFTMPGDTVVATTMGKKSGKTLALLDEVINPAKERIAPRCVHFAKCGGCLWQHIPYPMQLNYKQQWVMKQFKEIISDETVCHPIIACDPPWQYRNKMEFSFSQDKQGNRFLGLIQSQSRGKVLDLTECHLVNPWFVEVLNSVRTWWQETGLAAYHPATNRGALRTLTVREGFRSHDRLVMLTVSGVPEEALNRSQIDHYVRAVKESCTPPEGRGELSIFLRIQQAIKGQPTRFYEMHLGGPDHIRESMTLFGRQVHFQVGPSSFFQPNTLQAERLYQRAFELANMGSDDLVYDLYCGTGTIGVCAARSVKRVVGVELSHEAVYYAKENVKANGLSNTDVLQGDVGVVLETLHEKYPDPDVVIVDPPRVGLDAVAMGHMDRLRPKTILYISCNPATQAVNIGEWVAKGYRIEALQAVDQFSHTPHVENIAVLRRISS
jgi:23S rRNA (uracil1939-C5)-methyltransferase